MAIYHILPMTDPRKKDQFIETIQTDTNLNDEGANYIRESALAFKQRVLKNITYKKKFSESDVYYLFDDDTENSQSFSSLIRILKNGDELIIHGEGEPFVLGLPAVSIFDTHGRSLAELLKANNFPDLDINIKLLACNSTVNYRIQSERTGKSVTVHFARDMANALYHEFQYSNLKVTGYTGFIVEKGNNKYTVSAQVNSPHGSSLEHAAAVYRGGECISPPIKTVIGDLSNFAFSGDLYVEPKKNAFKGHQITERAILQNRSSTPENRPQFVGSSHSLFHQNKASTNHDVVKVQLNSNDNASRQEEKKDEKDAPDAMLPPMP